jgi:ADP-ribose pyrophosphatase
MFKILGSKHIYKARVFDVYEDTICLPDAREVKYSRIQHGKSVAIIPLTAQHEIILIKQFRYATGDYLIEIPAGTMDKGPESAVECAQRELAEETGFQAKTLVQVFEGYSLPGYCSEYMYYYIATDLYPAPLPPDEDEFIEQLPVPFEKALAMVKSGEIKDAKTALGILLVEQYLRNKKG